MSDQVQVLENKPNHFYRTEIPNCIDDADLDVYQFRVYCRIKRIAGDGGQCFQSHKTLAEHCGISERKLISVLHSLCGVNKKLGVPLLIKYIRKNDDKSNQSNIYIVNDVWDVNGKLYKKNTLPPGAPGAPPPLHDVHPPGAPGAEKEEPIKKNPIEESSSSKRQCSEKPPKAKDPDLPAAAQKTCPIAEAVRIAQSPLPERIPYMGQNRSLRHFVRSDAHRHFVALGVEPGVIDEALHKFSMRKGPCTNPIKLLDHIVADIIDSKKYSKNLQSIEEDRIKKQKEDEEYQKKLEEVRKKPRGKFTI